ncbi:MAG: hypothetical protein HFF50_06345 [Lawsonibacter sp.]|nr:hypothetical protein [Lawsonibacter sp.]
MRKKLLLHSLVLLVLLAGCAGAPETADPAAIAAFAPSSSQEAPPEEVFVDDPDSPYPMAEWSWQVDMDGDGAEEQVVLWAEKAYGSNEIEPDKWFEVTTVGLHPYTLVVTAGEEEFRVPLGREESGDFLRYPYYFPLDSEYSAPIWTEDRSGLPVLVLAFDNMSQGGAGGIDVYAFALREGALIRLPVPEYSVEAALNEEALTALVTVPETGYTETLDLNQWLEDKRARESQFNWDPSYDESGALEWPAAPGNIDGLCAAEAAEEGIILSQYLYGTAHMDGMGFLTTTLTWDKEEPVVLDQRFVWC